MNGFKGYNEFIFLEVDNMVNIWINYTDEEKRKEEINEIKEIINDFANHGQFSVNNEHVKALYRRLRELEGRKQLEEEDYKPKFINGSDVPISGYYE